MSESQQKLLDEIMDGFNFSRVADAMDSLRWVWFSSGGVPCESEIRVAARVLLSQVILNGGNVATGGFKAEYIDGELSLAFMLDEYSAFEDENQLPSNTGMLGFSQEDIEDLEESIKLK